MLDRAYGSIDVTAVPPGGKRISLLKLDGPRPRWFYRYWLQDPLEVAKGTIIEVTAVPLADYSDELKSGPSFPLHVNVDYVAQ